MPPRSTSRTKARKRALEVLYEADLKGADPVTVLSDRITRRAAQGPGSSDPEIGAYTVALVEGATKHLPRIDDLLSTYSVGWTLDRMPAVDRNILRLGVYELLWGDAPDEVVLSEAVGLARELSTDDSPQFVNGLLGRIQELKPTLVR